MYQIFIYFFFFQEYLLQPCWSITNLLSEPWFLLFFSHEIGLSAHAAYYCTLETVNFLLSLEEPGPRFIIPKPQKEVQYYVHCPY